MKILSLLLLVSSSYAKFLNQNKELILTFENILDLANMSHNAYFKPQDYNWLNTSLPEIQDLSINNDSLKVYLFRHPTTKTNVISIKGTSLYWNNHINYTHDTCDLDPTIYSSTYYNDKVNDNLYFSCCYYKQSNLFETCTSCKQEQDNYHDCCTECYNNSTHLELNYLNIGSTIVENLKSQIDFDNEEIIFTGHSLGATVASLLAIKYNKVGVGFQSPGDKHYANMINMDYQNKHIYHFGHNADPIFMGDCGSTCNMMGYHIYTRCHIGYTCTFNAKEKLNIGESLWTHRINYVINNIISNWKNDIPQCIKLDDCNDCENWKYTL